MGAWGSPQIRKERHIFHFEQKWKRRFFFFSSWAPNYYARNISGGCALMSVVRRRRAGFNFKKRGINQC